ncbi:hypothetical protein BJX64DRAFT_287152 [Aspergillus heterothallicus]
MRWSRSHHRRSRLETWIRDDPISGVAPTLADQCRASLIQQKIITVDGMRLAGYFPTRNSQGFVEPFHVEVIFLSNDKLPFLPSAVKRARTVSRDGVLPYVPVVEMLLYALHRVVNARTRLSPTEQNEACQVLQMLRRVQEEQEYEEDARIGADVCLELTRSQSRFFETVLQLLARYSGQSAESWGIKVKVRD